VKGKFLPVGILFMVLVMALAALGVGYGHWTKTLDINGSVTTGEVNADFDSASTSDTGIDPGYTKDVGTCTVSGVGTQTLTITVDNAYPSYTCDVDFTITNTGTIPLKVNALSLTGGAPEVTVDWTTVAVGQQIEPGEEAPGDIHIHVEQCAAENTTYTFDAQIELIQWNYGP
jgi:hypothetical protein